MIQINLLPVEDKAKLREKEKKRAWYQANKEKVSAYNKARYNADPEKFINAVKARYAADPEKKLIVLAGPTPSNSHSS